MSKEITTGARLTETSTVKKLLEDVGAVASRARGQNFLVSEQVVTKTIEAVASAPRHATELGAGLGTLTQALLVAGFEVKAIEQDDKLVQILPQSAPEEYKDKLHIIHDDLRTTPWAWELPYIVIGNIPYNLSGLVFRLLTELQPAPERAVFLVQKEVAERIVCQPPDMNLLALAIALWGQAQIILSVPPHFFWPQPQVSSSLITITPHQKSLLTPAEQHNLMKLARHLFQGKRKQIGKRLQALTGKEDIVSWLAEMNLKPTQRPQELSVTDWITLAKAVYL